MRDFTLLFLALAIGCGGKVIVDDGGSGGASGSSVMSSSSMPATTSVTTGPSHCSDHADCPGGLCIFTTGECAESCEANACDACTEGTFCESCATSSCAGCENCLAACVSLSESRCDDNDGCPDGQACLFSGGVCTKQCTSQNDCGGFATCEPCATGSCCGCDDCVRVCIGGE